MAGIILENIINETLSNSFRGTDVFANAMSASMRPANGGFNSDNEDLLNLPSESIEDPMNNLTQSIEMTQYERIFWIMIFSIMVLVAAGGNTIVVYIVSTNKEMKSVTNYFLVNLSLADTMVSILNVVFNFISMLNR